VDSARTDQRLDIFATFGFVRTVVIGMQRNEPHENTVSRNPRSEFVGNPDRGDGSTACRLLIREHFPIETTFSLPFGGSGVDLLPCHFVDLLHFAKDGIEVC